MQEHTNKVGRPPGPVDPIKQHEAELMGWIKVHRRIRLLIEKQIGFLEKKLANAETGDGTVNLDGILEIMGALGTLLTTTSRVVETGIKTLDRPTGSDQNDKDPDKIMEELTGGRAG